MAKHHQFPYPAWEQAVIDELKDHGNFPYDSKIQFARAVAARVGHHSPPNFQFLPTSTLSRVIQTLKGRGVLEISFTGENRKVYICLKDTLNHQIGRATPGYVNGVDHSNSAIFLKVGSGMNSSAAEQLLILLSEALARSTEATWGKIDVTRREVRTLAERLTGIEAMLAAQNSPPTESPAHIEATGSLSDLLAQSERVLSETGSGEREPYELPRITHNETVTKSPDQSPISRKEGG